MVVTTTELNDVYAHTAEWINKCIIEFRLADCQFSEKQKERFLFLVGPRYNPKTGEVKYTVGHFKDFEHNKNKAIELIEESLLEAYRAPL